MKREVQFDRSVFLSEVGVSYIEILRTISINHRLEVGHLLIFWVDNLLVVVEIGLRVNLLVCVHGKNSFFKIYVSILIIYILK